MFKIFTFSYFVYASSDGAGLSEPMFVAFAENFCLSEPMVIWLKNYGKWHNEPWHVISNNVVFWQV